MRLGADGVRPLEGGAATAITFLVGRELCLFLYVDATKVPAKERSNYVALAVRQAAPYHDPEFDCSWLGDYAAVWYWSQGRVATLIPGTTGRVSFVSEGSHVGDVEDEGVQMFALASGFEGRIWRGRHLMASRWWPTEPVGSTWQAFVRGAGLPPATVMPAPIEVPIRGQRWSPAASGGLRALRGSQLESHLPRIYAGGVLCALCLFSWQLGSTVRAAIDARQAQQAVSALDDSLRQILEARSNADSAKAEIDALMRLREGVPQHFLLAEAARLLKDTSARVQLWQQPHPERIEVTLSMATPDPEAVVQTWEASPFFSDVNVELGRQAGSLLLRASIQDGRDAAQVSP